MFLNITFYIFLDPFDCEKDPCHLAWLIRDNRNLLGALRDATCSNGTKFERLNQMNSAIAHGRQLILHQFCRHLLLCF